MGNNGKKHTHQEKELLRPITNDKGGEELHPSIVERLASEAGVPVNMICVVCGRVIQVIAFKGTGICCESHRKIRDNDHEVTRVTY